MGGYHSLGLIDCKETYDLIKEPFKFMNDSFARLEKEGFIHNNKYYKIKMVFGADMSLAAKAQGIAPAHANHPCLLCTIHSNLFFKPAEHIFKQQNPELFPFYNRTHALCDKVLSDRLKLTKEEKNRSSGLIIIHYFQISIMTDMYVIRFISSCV
jgi:hypothetical protein